MLTKITNDKLIFPVFKTQDEIRGAASLARTSKLGVAGWSFFDIYRCLINHETTYEVSKMALCLDGSTPVGVAMAFESVECFGHGINIGAFVRKSHRRQNIGSRLVQAVKADPDSLIYHEGVAGSLHFWQANGGANGML